MATSSDAGIKPFANSAPYNVSKAGVISLVKTLAVECAPLGIRVNAVAPGETDTPMGFKELFGDEGLVEALEQRIPMNRIADPMEIAQVVLFLVSEASSYITGEVILVDGGRMLYNSTSQVLQERLG